MFNSQAPFQLYHRLTSHSPRFYRLVLLTLLAAALGTWGYLKIWQPTGKAAVHSAKPVRPAPTITDFQPKEVTAGQPMQIYGTDFSVTASDDTVIFTGSQSCSAPPKGEIKSATATQLEVIVPHCAGTGTFRVEVNNPQNYAESKDWLKIKTSISGFVQDTSRHPIEHATVRVPFISGTEYTNTEGSFFFPGVPPSNGLIFEVDGLFLKPPFGADARMMPVRTNCDNLYPGFIELGPLGEWITVARFNSTRDVAVSLADELIGLSLVGYADKVMLQLAKGARVRFPDGSMSGKINLAEFTPGRAPAPLPAGHFSSSIAQIVPFGATIMPGAQLIFPNRDQLPPKQQVTLFRFDQTRNSRTFGRFVEAGTAVVSSDGQQVTTAATAIKELSYYFASLKRPTGTLNGRVLETNGQPVPNALVVARGQYVLTDGRGNYVLRGVPVLTVNDRLTVEVSMLRPDGRVDRASPQTVASITAGGETQVPPIVLRPR